MSLSDFKSTALQVLSESTAYQLIPESGKVVIFDSQLKVQYAFLGLVEHDVKCAPLWDSAQEKFIGMITVTDFIDILAALETTKLDNDSAFFGDIGQQTCASWLELKTKVANSKGPRPLVPESGIIYVLPETSLLDCVRIYSEKGFHRLPVVDSSVPDKPVLCIANHQRVLRIMISRLPSSVAKDLASIKVADLPFGTLGESCPRVSPSTSVAEVISMLHKSRFPAIPIVDSKSGAYVDAFSRSDVRLLALDGKYDHLRALSVSNALAAYQSQRIIPTCQPTETLDRLFHRLLGTRKHALVLVDADLKLLGMISLSEVFDWIVAP